MHGARYIRQDWLLVSLNKMHGINFTDVFILVVKNNYNLFGSDHGGCSILDFEEKL